jgi:hypothetical protein
VSAAAGSRSAAAARRPPPFAQSPVRRFSPACGRSAAALLTAALLAAGCAEAPAIGDGPYAKLLGRVVPKVEAAAGVPFKTPPVLETRSREEVQAFVRQQLESDRARDLLAGQELVYRRLGVIPDTMSLPATLGRVLDEQIAGYYDPKTDVLYVVEDVAPELVEVTVAHELVHALQDQYIDIDSIQDQTADADRQVAAQAVLEGQAVWGQLVSTLGETALRMGGWERARMAIRDAQDGLPVFASAPMILRESLLFPYVGGADFVFRFTARRPAEALLGDMPLSTKQVLNDDAYFGDLDGDAPPATAATRDGPTTVELSAPARGELVHDNTVGEYETRLVIYHFLRDEAIAQRGARGVDGDRMQGIRLPDGEDALVWASVWDSPLEAAEFASTMADWLGARYDVESDDPADAPTRRWRVPATDGAAAREVLLRGVEVDGRPVMLFVDAPARAADALADGAQVTLRP